MPSTINLTLINASGEHGQDHFVGFQNVTVEGPPRVILHQIVTHLKAGCYSIVSLNIYPQTCVAVISSTLPLAELRRRGFHWLDISSPSPPDSPHPDSSPLSQDELDRISKTIHAETSTEMVRMDFINPHWRSSYNIIRGGYHHKSLSRALILVDDAIKAGCFKLEALSAVRDWCTVTIDSDLSKEELKAKGFRWHGLETADVPDEDGCIVLPGHDRSGDGYEDQDGNWVTKEWEWRDL